MRPVKLFCSVVCLLAVLFIGVGYASLSGELSITGTVTYSVPDIYIASAEPLTPNGTNVIYSETMFSATSSFSGGSSVVYRITVVNTTSVDYGYLMTAAITNEILGAGNALVNYEVFTNEACTTPMNRGTVLPPMDSNGDNQQDQNLVFYVKITPKSAATTSATVYLNFKFVTPVTDIPAADAEIGALAANQAADSFARILNDSTLMGSLKGQMENTQAAKDNNRDNKLLQFFVGLTTTDTIAYVPDTIAMNASLNPSDAEVCLELFGGENLTLNIDGVDQNVYFMIYKTDVDGIGDSEYVLYMTTNPLTDTTTVSWTGYNLRKTAIVYAAVFTAYTNGGQTSYFQLGDMLTGESTICDYSGSDGNGVKETLALVAGRVSGSGSFNSSDWKTTEAYYGLNTGASINSIMQAKATKNSACMAALKTQLDKAKEILEYEKVVGGVTFTAEDLYTEESLNHLKTVYGYGDVEGLSDVYDKIMNGDSTSYTQAMVVTVTRWMNEALVGLKAK